MANMDQLPFEIQRWLEVQRLSYIQLLLDTRPVGESPGIWPPADRPRWPWPCTGRFRLLWRWAAGRQCF
jgi:hypothetical protein